MYGRNLIGSMRVSFSSEMLHLNANSQRYTAELCCLATAYNRSLQIKCVLRLLGDLRGPRIQDRLGAVCTCAVSSDSYDGGGAGKCIRRESSDRRSRGADCDPARCA